MFRRSAVDCSSPVSRSLRPPSRRAVAAEEAEALAGEQAVAEPAQGAAELERAAAELAREPGAAGQVAAVARFTS